MTDDRETEEDEPEVLFESEPNNLVPLRVRRKKHGDTGAVIETNPRDDHGGNQVSLLSDEMPGVIGALVRAFMEDADV